MKNFVQPGTTLTLPAPYDLTSGAGFLVGALFAIACGDAAAGAQVQGVTGGVFTLPKTAAQAWAVGARIYWDDLNKRCDVDSAKGSLIGVATVVALNSSTVGHVRLNGRAAGGGGNAATVPGQPAKPVLTAMAGAVSVAWAPGAAGSSATTSNIWTDINGIVTQLTTNPQVITAQVGTPYTGTVTTLNVQGAGPASVQADTVTPTAAPATLRTFETFDVNGNNTNTFNRVAVAELGRTSLIIRSPAGNTAQIALGYRDADNLNNPNPDFSAPVLINPGEEMFSDNDQLQYFARQNAATAVPGQYVEIEKVITL